MKILDYLNQNINKAHSENTLSLIGKLTLNKLRIKVFTETHLGRLREYALDKDADVFVYGYDCVYLITDVTKSISIMKKVKSFMEKKDHQFPYAMFKIDSDSEVLMFGADDKEDLLDAYAYAVSIGYAFDKADYDDTFGAMDAYLADLNIKRGVGVGHKKFT